MLQGSFPGITTERREVVIPYQRPLPKPLPQREGLSSSNINKDYSGFARCDRNSIMINETIDNARYRVQKIKLKTEQEEKPPILGNIRYLFTDRQRIDRNIIKLFYNISIIVLEKSKLSKKEVLFISLIG
jgi:hypothetical protein